MTRAGTQLAASSRRAEAQPKFRYLAERCPTIASSVLTARYATRPGIPATAPHSSGATTASDVFSATDSITARAISVSSSCGRITAAEAGQHFPGRGEIVAAEREREPVRPHGVANGHR